MLQKIKSEPALVSGFIQAVLGLLLAFGVHLTLVQTGAIMALTGAGLAFFVRSQVTPLAPAKRNESGQVSFLQLLIAILVILAILWLVGLRFHVG